MARLTDPDISVRNKVYIAACIAVFICAAANVFTVFAQPLQEATGGTSSQVALALTIYQTVMATFGIISGRIADRVGPRALTFVGGVVFAAGWALTAVAGSVPLLWISYGVIAGAGNGLLYNPALNAALRWFPEKRGTMSGIMLGVVSLGAMIMSKGGAALSERFGTRGFFVFAIAFLILSMAAGTQMRAPEPGWRPEGWDPGEVTGDVVTTREYSGLEMMRTGRFWIMIVLFALACTSGMMMIGSLSAIGQAQLGLTAIAAANLVVINAFANFVGRLSVGRLCDRIGELKTMAIILVTTIVALVGLRMPIARIATDEVSVTGGTYAMFVVFLCLLGAAFGGVLVVFPPLTSKAFGLKNAGLNYGIMFFGYAIGSFIGPQIAATLVRSDEGPAAYSFAFLVAMAVAALGLVLNGALLATLRTPRKSTLTGSSS